MNGAEFLSRAREATPDTVRLLLTGQSDMESAIRAVNEGQIFRFLTKPCPPKVLRGVVRDAARQHELLRVEKELLGKTLRGAVDALTEILALANPLAFGRTARITELVETFLDKLEVEPRWPLELAARCSQLGSVALPEPLLDKVYVGASLSSSEQAQVKRAREVPPKLLSSIPRLEPVLAALTRNGEEDPLAPAQFLRLAEDYDALERQGRTTAEIARVLASRGRYPQALLDALPQEEGSATAALQEVTLVELMTGMVLAADVRTRDGLLLVAPGSSVTAGLLERLRNYGSDRVVQPILVRGEPAVDD